MSKQPSHRTIAHGVRVIEKTISPDGDPVIGLYLFMAYGRLMRTMDRNSPFAVINPVAIGIPALLKAHPGLSQTELADMMGVERMTAGMHVKLCLSKGLVERRSSKSDRRKYELYVSRKGLATLNKIAKSIPLHERHVFKGLSHKDQADLYRILGKFIASNA
jgi:DNA-binding MarR family transcriptional regulator